MASSSTSSVPKSFKYDVFLSFRGEDTRTNFVDHLYNALRAKSIQTYKDDEEINRGKRIKDELIGSIKDSKFYIIVFSKNYASSSWCLDELVTIMECQKKTEHTAYPVFYGVEPTEVRNQNGAIGEAFAKHESKDDAEKWRKAMEEAASLAGWDLKTERYEAKLIQNIVEVLSLELRPINFSVDEKLIGMETRINDVVSFLGMGFDDVRMLGIKGIGGGGKTTLARAVFDRISFQFEGQSFVENVREASKPSLSGLKSLQNQVLKDVLNDQSIEVSSVSEGKNMMKRRMHDKKVLLVLDDVDCLEQLEALAKPNWFKSESTIIITTRDEQVLISHRVNLIRDVNLLSGEEAICLFSRYAFGKEGLIQGYEDLSRQVVKYAAGLPLTIRILGSFLCGKNMSEWMDAIERLKTVPLKETQKKLELSYNSLEQDYKEIFLDVACILKGQRKDIAIRALESCGFHARNGLRVLEQRSLITISHGYLGMHDHIEEMGKNIVRRSHPGKPNKHSRLWISKEIEDILANNRGTCATRCIRLHQLELNPEIAMKGLRNMKDLRFLEVSLGFNKISDKAGQYFPNALRYLVWSYYPFRSLPKTFHADNLVTLEMPYSNIVQLWEGGERKVLNELRFLDLHHSMLTNFDLGLTPNLEILSLKGCAHLVELHTVAACVKLKSLDLKQSKLRSLDLGSTLNLEVLDLEGCLDLLDLYIPDRWLNLRSFKLGHSRLRTFNIGLVPNLELLHVEECKDLVELHMPSRCLNLKSLTLIKLKLRTLGIGLTPNLKYLNLERCYDLEELYMAHECQRLSALDVSHSKLKSLDLGLTPNLKILTLTGCAHLVELHRLAACLNLRSLCLKLSKLRSLDLRSTLNLQVLDLEGCLDLVDLHMPHIYLNLRSLNINHSGLRTFDIGLTPNLKLLHVKECKDLVELQMSGICLYMSSLKLRHLGLRKLDIRLAPNLKLLHIEECKDLVELQMSHRCLDIRSLKLIHSGLRTFDIGLAPKLELLDIQGCKDLIEFQMDRSQDIKSLKFSHSGLRMLNITLVPNIKRLLVEVWNDFVEHQISNICLDLGSLKPIPIQMYNTCIDLRSLKLSHSGLRMLDIGVAPNLELLHVEECKELVEIQMPNRCLDIRSLKLSHSGLRTFDIGLVPNLELLHIEECKDLVELQMSNRCLDIRSLKFSHSGLRMLDIVLETKLEPLHVEECKDLEELQMSNRCLNLGSVLLSHSELRTLDIARLPNLDLLHVEEYKDLVKLQMPSRYRNLRSLTITKSKLRTLDIGMTPNLEYLNLESCYDLEELHMTHECQKLSTLNVSHSKLKTLDLKLTPNLKKLDLKNCYDLVDIQPPIECLKKLVHLDLGLRFRSFWFHTEDNTCSSVDESLEAVSLATVNLIAEFVETCTSHPDNNLPKYQFRCFWRQDLALFSRYVEKQFSVAQCACTNLETFSGSICGLESLRTLTLEGYPEVPKGLNQFECLEGLILSWSKIKNLPDNIHMLKHLKFLQLESCWLLEKLPENLDLVECIEKLILRDCMFLRDIPESICNMNCLRVLYIEDTCISQLPKSISLLQGLRIYGSRAILQSFGFTSETILPSECDMYCYVDSYGLL